ncbi:MAG: hypothetical protein KDD40_11205, partial [Bdellovibrionales bacterium]|nr:hypothetical protein [Bdellovibrionales bacterium]
MYIQKIKIFSILILIMQFVFLPMSRAAHLWNLNDVSILFPLPNESVKAIDLIAPYEQSGLGSLISQDVYQMVPPLINADLSNQEMFHQSLHAVSLRFDPCPSDENNICYPEVRIVWQPLMYDKKSQQWTGRDATLHSFYRLNEQQFNSVKSQLWKLKLANEKLGITTNLLPLNIHPAFQNQLTQSKFLNGVKELILEHCGSQNLFKLTFMSLLVPSRWWRFGSFVKDVNNNWQDENIPRID